MTAITASEASYTAQTAATPSQPDLDAKYGLFNVIVKNAAAAGSWTTLVTVAERNSTEFSTWAQALGFAVLASTSLDTAVNIDGEALALKRVFLVSWRKIDTVTLRDMVSIHEGDQLKFDIVPVGYLEGDQVFWRNSGTTNAQDFGLGPAILRPQGPWLTAKTIEAWSLENAAMARLIRLRSRAEGNTALVTRYERQIAQLKNLLEYRAGLLEQNYETNITSQYEGALTFVKDTVGLVKATIDLLVTRDKGMEQATGLTEINETLIINIYADQACTQLLKTSSTYTVVNEQ
jgi:hypothetical protein